MTEPETITVSAGALSASSSWLSSLPEMQMSRATAGVLGLSPPVAIMPGSNEVCCLVLNESVQFMHVMSYEVSVSNSSLRIEIVTDRDS